MEEQEFVNHPLIKPNTVEYREYQVNIAKEAYGKNALVILPTALGKTVIALLLAAETFYRQKSKKILIMAPTRPLVVQHFNNFKKTMNLPESYFLAITGRIPPEERAKLWKSGAKIIFSTPQVIKNDIELFNLNLSDFSLLVFDEAHRAVKDYAYTYVAKRYVSSSEYPMILGLTASPGASEERIMEVCKNLFIEKIIYRDEYDQDVRPYVHRVELEVVKVNLPSSYEKIKKIIESLLGKRLAWLYQNGFLSLSPSEVKRKDLIELGERLRELLNQDGVNKGAVYQAIANQSAALTLFHMLELLETQGVNILKNFLESWEREEKRFKSIIISDEDYLKLKLELDEVSEPHPKLSVLKEIVEKQMKDSPSSRIIIFTQFRDTANAIVEMLGSVPGVRASRFVGQASKKEDKGMKQEEQVRLLKMLEEGQINVLVATSIGEEGLDIPSVDLVIFYEPIPSEIRFIQRKGRTGRKGPGRAIILTTRSGLDPAYLYSSLRKVRKMREIINNLNLSLQPIFRPLPRPPEEPWSEAPEVKQAQKKVVSLDQMKKIVYKYILERPEKGASKEELASFVESSGIDPINLELALKELLKEKLIYELQGSVYVPYSSLKKGFLKSHVVEVLKVEQGHALVEVDGKWHARLLSSDYNGPKDLIKKGKSFEAALDFYKLNGITHVIVKEVFKEL